VDLQELSLDVDEIKKVKKIFITACGTAYHAGLVGKYVIESLARIPVEIDIASEFRYRDLVIDSDSLLVVISQSGETADTIAALREARRRGVPVIAITNVVDSSVAREAGHVLYTWAGPEIAVASTKAYTAQLMALYLLALHLANERKTIPEEESRELVGELLKLSEKASLTLDGSERIRNAGVEFTDSSCILFIGRGLDYAVASEGSLKLKEISYIHAEAYAAGELKHGTLALIEKDVPVITVATQPFLFEKTLSNIKEVKAREATVLALAMEGLCEVEKEADQVFYIPRTHPLLTPVLSVIPLQLLAYYAAVARGCDVDQPRNLAKSVTFPFETPAIAKTLSVLIRRSAIIIIFVACHKLLVLLESSSALSSSCINSLKAIHTIKTPPINFNNGILSNNTAPMVSMIRKTIAPALPQKMDSFLCFKERLRQARAISTALSPLRIRLIKIIPNNMVMYSMQPTPFEKTFLHELCTCRAPKATAVKLAPSGYYFTSYWSVY
jgi:fructoselysine-6-P-deglycase FrlB-like protein